MIRKWRVGTVSMGMSLIFLGVVLFLTQIKGVQMMEPLMIWWPLILIVLGIEIIVYLFVARRQENPVLKYDFMSIIFIGILGSIAIGVTLLMSVGIMPELKAYIQSETKTLSLPSWETRLPMEIQKIVIEAGSQRVKIEGSATQEVHVLGTYRTSMNKDQPDPIPTIEELAVTKIIGDTYYIIMKDPSQKSAPFSTYTYVNATIVVPDHLEVEVRGNYSIHESVTQLSSQMQ